MKKVNLLLSVFVFGFILYGRSQINVTGTNSATALAQTLVGFGVTVSNATLNCGSAPQGSTDYGSGIFTVTSSNLGMVSRPKIG